MLLAKDTCKLKCLDYWRKQNPSIYRGRIKLVRLLTGVALGVVFSGHTGWDYSVFSRRVRSAHQPLDSPQTDGWPMLRRQTCKNDKNRKDVIYSVEQSSHSNSSMSDQMRSQKYPGCLEVTVKQSPFASQKYDSGGSWPGTWKWKCFDLSALWHCTWPDLQATIRYNKWDKSSVSVRQSVLGLLWN